MNISKIIAAEKATIGINSDFVSFLISGYLIIIKDK